MRLLGYFFYRKIKNQNKPSAQTTSKSIPPLYYPSSFGHSLAEVIAYKDKDSVEMFILWVKSRETFLAAELLAISPQMTPYPVIYVYCRNEKAKPSAECCHE
ncbi:hypothetical protein AVEN_66829-1 [Araneus ventricosus]|uniref:Uncharacterized protein n=1 Tax=Araneus ventricosus TaxID=182803 RepID=A0A4Y2DNX1_ARAVE|nr:hypothetical protein AVEN_66829-1 [Araneus ventricosus]